MTSFDSDTSPEQSAARQQELTKALQTITTEITGPVDTDISQESVRDFGASLLDIARHTVEGVNDNFATEIKKGSEQWAQIHEEGNIPNIGQLGAFNNEVLKLISKLRRLHHLGRESKLRLRQLPGGEGVINFDIKTNNPNPVGISIDNYPDEPKQRLLERFSNIMPTQI